MRRANQLLPGHHEIVRLIVITLVCRSLLDSKKPLFISRQGSRWDETAVTVRDDAFQRYFPEFNTAFFGGRSAGCRLMDADAFGLKLYSKNMWLKSETVARTLGQVRAPLLGAHSIGSLHQSLPTACALGQLTFSLRAFQSRGSWMPSAWCDCS